MREDQVIIQTQETWQKYQGAWAMAKRGWSGGGEEGQMYRFCQWCC